MPEINFHYFDEGTGAVDDLASVPRAWKPFAASPLAAKAQSPRRFSREGIRSAEQIRQFIEGHAPGPHASCSCKIGLQATPAQ